MRKLSGNEIRKMWLDFFKSKEHHIERGASLIPHNDPTLLWINAGVAALKKYFDGSEIPPSRRISNAQKCIRTNDIENVGHTARHHTFFEMLGNFSIGDYFRKDAIAFAAELLFADQWFAFDRDLIYITYHPNDLETKKCWMDNGIKESHLIPLEGNFWEIGEGPCGPDTEIFYDRGVKYDKDNIGIDLLKNDIENDRYIEIWNIVFSQFNSEAGKKREEYKELPSKNIDTGCGLERLACVMQEVETNFDTDLFYPLIEEVNKLTGIDYKANTLAYRVIADHIRAITFALSDGEMFSNEGRGYVLRRLLRRAERYGRVLGINHPFLFNLVDVVNEMMKDYYPYLLEKKEFVKKMIKAEEEKFIKTLANGELQFAKMTNNVSSLSAKDMFMLYDTFGFPKELTMEMCEEKNIAYDLDGFNLLMQEQKERARKARGDLQSMNKQSKDLLDCTVSSIFTYGFDDIETEVVALFNNGEKVDSIFSEGDIILKETIFYAESGGQVSDTGTIENKEVAMNVVSVNKAPNKQHLHHVELLFGEVKVGDKVTLKIDKNKRLKIMRNHSSVHLLQKALTEVLGDHIAQQGSYVNDEYSHFDFNHFNKITPEQLNEVERKVNAWISDSIPCETKVLAIEEAKKLGARALFDDKYGDTVRVVCFDEVSKEFCGGTHVKNSEDIGLFVIEYEESVAAGIRRIQARTSSGAYELIKRRENILNRHKELLSCSSYAETNARLVSLINEKEELKKNLEALNNKLAYLTSQNMINNFIDYNGIKVLSMYLENKKRNDLLSLIDNLKNKYEDNIIVLIGDDGNGLPISVSISKSVVAKGYKAGDIVKNIATILGGSGGGRPDLASGAGKNKDKLDEALKYIETIIK